MTTRPLIIPVIRGTATASKAEHELAYWLARWIETEEIAKGEVADAVAGSLIVAQGLVWVAREYGNPNGSQALHDAASALADGADLSLEEWVTENWNHGHLAEDMRRN